MQPSQGWAVDPDKLQAYTSVQACEELMLPEAVCKPFQRAGRASLLICNEPLFTIMQKLGQQKALKPSVSVQMQPGCFRAWNRQSDNLSVMTILKTNGNTGKTEVNRLGQHISNLRAFHRSMPTSSSSSASTGPAQISFAADMSSASPEMLGPVHAQA